ncbi:AraC family transcriptional regulator [Vallitalea okinawensis]|uniref:AraC family transcriptional regulator n=1 Tax=Vallitalea okinawensis TaxID=2078660 RepID=UPI000CFB3C67|nr:AraC family transcriptional regulator [Vallitalea okinawensis]
MDWIKKMKCALDYVEDNLAGEIDMNVVAQKACCSSYNFQRMFSFITDVSLAEYIRRRRLTLAAFEIQNSDIKVIDVAMKYGYESPVSFARAFQALHGITPSMARKDGAKLKAYPCISFQISIKGEKEMDYRIEKKDSFEVFGIEALVSTVGDTNYLTQPGQLWTQCHQNGSYERLYKDAGKLPSFIGEDLCKIHGVMNYRKADHHTFPYMLCSFVNDESNTEGYTKVKIPAQTWAIFPSPKTTWDKISSVFGSLNKRFYTEWLPTSDYEKAEGPELEIYGGTEDVAYVELWIPVIKK